MESGVCIRLTIRFFVTEQSKPHTIIIRLPDDSLMFYRCTSLPPDSNLLVADHSPVKGKLYQTFRSPSHNFTGGGGQEVLNLTSIFDCSCLSGNSGLTTIRNTAHTVPQSPHRLRNDLKCVEREVKPYHAIMPCHTIPYPYPYPFMCSASKTGNITETQNTH